jgi:hypothetical protein
VFSQTPTPPVPTLHDGSRDRLICQGGGECRADAGGRGQPKESPSIELAGGGPAAETGQEALVVAFQMCI